MNDSTNASDKTSGEETSATAIGFGNRCINKVLLIGNLTRDPELRFTAQGIPVCTFGMATNRYWKTDTGERKEETEWHRIVAWRKLAEICGKILFKGRRVYVEGRIQTRSWTGQDGQERRTTEIVAYDMIVLDDKHKTRGFGTANDAAVADTGAVKIATDVDMVQIEEEKEEKKADEIAKAAEIGTDAPEIKEEKKDKKDLPF